MRILPLLDASILLLIAVQLVPLLSINFISVKLFECYFGPLVRCIDTCWCYLKGDINCNYYYYYYYYIGRTSQRLQDRIKQHVSKTICSCSSSQKCLLPARRCKSSIQTNTQSLASDSAIGLHLLQNPTCAQHYDDSRFSILAQGRSPFNLYALEATFIKTSNPAFCRQKEFVYSLKIVH